MEEHMFQHVPVPFLLFPQVCSRLPPFDYICGARLPPKNISHQKQKCSRSLKKKRDGRRWCLECGSASVWGATQPPEDGHIDWSHILCHWKWWQRALSKSRHVLVKNYWCVACIETLQYSCANTTHKLQTSSLNLVRNNTHSWGQRGKWEWIENCLCTTQICFGPWPVSPLLPTCMLNKWLPGYIFDKSSLLFLVKTKDLVGLQHPKKL